MNQRERARIEREYTAKLESFVDDIYEIAHDVWDYSWAELAEQAGCSYTTVWRLGMRVTRWPRLQTIYKLAQAVGMDIGLLRGEIDQMARAA